MWRVQVATNGTAELALLRALLQFNPTDRPAALASLKMDYFQELPPEEQPLLSEAPDPEQIQAAFSFERETLGSNELRILLANDLFRINFEGGEEAPGAS